jgi:hypothetical protein
VGLIRAMMKSQPEAFSKFDQIFILYINRKPAITE